MNLHKNIPNDRWMGSQFIRVCEELVTTRRGAAIVTNSCGLRMRARVKALPRRFRASPLPRGREMRTAQTRYKM
jgi:hypothetical protein